MVWGMYSSSVISASTCLFSPGKFDQLCDIFQVPADFTPSHTQGHARVYLETQVSHSGFFLFNVSLSVCLLYVLIGGLGMNKIFDFTVAFSWSVHILSICLLIKPSQSSCLFLSICLLIKPSQSSCLFLSICLLIGRSSQILKSKQCNPLICDIKEGHKASTQTKFH